MEHFRSNSPNYINSFQKWSLLKSTGEPMGGENLREVAGPWLIIFICQSKGIYHRLQFILYMYLEYILYSTYDSVYTKLKSSYCRYVHACFVIRKDHGTLVV